MKPATVTAIPQTEADFQRRIIEFAQLMGWRVLHVRAQKTETGWHVGYEGDSGFVDLLVARDGVVHCWELKRDERSPYQPGQREWIDALGARVMYASVSADWDEIVALLSAPRKRTK